MRLRSSALPSRHPRHRSLISGILIAVLLVATESSVARLFALVTPVQLLDAVYLVGILMIASMWGLRLGLATAVASAIAFDLFVTPPLWVLRPATGPFLATLVIFLVTALLAGAISFLARSSASTEPGAILAGETHAALPSATRVVPASRRTPAFQHLRDRAVPLTPLQTARERDALHRIADEQAALRNLATLVAHSVPPSEVFDAVADEMIDVLGTMHAVIARYEPDGTAVVTTGSWTDEEIVAAGTRWELEKGTVADLVFRTKTPGRIHHEGCGRLATRLRERGVSSSAGCPIMVGHDLWGVAIASSSTPEPLPAETEERMLDFTELAATALSNAQSHSDLIASRARVFAATDETRRRIERALHDRTQQNLVSLSLEMRAIEDAIPPELDQLRQRLSGATQNVTNAVTELQEISRGLHPAIVTRGGLRPALAVLARRSAVAVQLNMPADRRLPEHLEVSIYYMIAEALANVAAHSQAPMAYVDLAISDKLVHLSIRDDGIGGADPAGGSGLIGLIDRVSALGGHMEIASPVGGGTMLRAEIPIE